MAYNVAGPTKSNLSFRLDIHGAGIISPRHPRRWYRKVVLTEFNLRLHRMQPLELGVEVFDVRHIPGHMWHYVAKDKTNAKKDVDQREKHGELAAVAPSDYRGSHNKDHKSRRDGRREDDNHLNDRVPCPDTIGFL